MLRQKIIILKTLTMSKTVTGGPLGFLKIHFVAKPQKMKGELLETIKLFEKSLTLP